MTSSEKKRLAYLDAMGIQVWTARLPGSGATRPDLPEAVVSPPLEGGGRSGGGSPGEVSDAPNFTHLSGRAPSSEPVAIPPPDTAMPAPDRLAAGHTLPPSSLDAKREPESSEAVEPQAAGYEPFWDDDDFLEYLVEAPMPEPQVSAGDSVCDWDTLEKRVAACTACPLHSSRTQTVFGVGDRNADWMVIGEAPGEQEDLKGEPFVGPAGMLLNEMLRAIGLSREKVYIANILKCRPPKNRDPQPAEAEACENHLRQQLALVKPRLILAVGRIAAQNLLKTATPIGKLRGLVHRYENIPLVVTYHPAYLLRSPSEKRRAWDDLRLALKIYRNSQ